MYSASCRERSGFCDAMSPPVGHSVLNVAAFQYNSPILFHTTLPDQTATPVQVADGATPPYKRPPYKRQTVSTGSCGLCDAMIQSAGHYHLAAAISVGLTIIHHFYSAHDNLQLILRTIGFFGDYVTQSMQPRPRPINCSCCKAPLRTHTQAAAAPAATRTFACIVNRCAKCSRHGNELPMTVNTHQPRHATQQRLQRPLRLQPPLSP